MKSIIRSITVFAILVACNGLYGMFSQAYRAARTGTRAATTAAVDSTSTITPKTSSSTSEIQKEEVAQRRVYANQAKSTSADQSEEGSKAAVSQQGNAVQGQRTTQIKNPGYSGSYLANMPKKKHVPGAGLKWGDIQNWVFSKLGWDTIPATGVQSQTLAQPDASGTGGWQPRPLIQPQISSNVILEAPLNPPAKPSYLFYLMLSPARREIEDAFAKVHNNVETAIKQLTLHNIIWQQGVFLQEKLVDDYRKAVDNFGGDYNIVNRSTPDHDGVPRTDLFTIINVAFTYLMQAGVDFITPQKLAIEKLYKAGARLNSQEKTLLYDVVKQRVASFQAQPTKLTLSNLKMFSSYCLLLDEIGVDLSNANIDLSKARQLNQTDVGELGNYPLQAIENAGNSFKAGQPYHGSQAIGIPEALVEKAAQLSQLIFIPLS